MCWSASTDTETSRQIIVTGDTIPDMTDIAVLTTVHNVFDTRIFHKQAVSLSDAGYEVTILGHHDQDEIRDGVKVKSIGTADSKIDRWRNLRTIYRAAKNEDAEAYHFHDPELLPVGAALKRSTGSNVIYDVHEDYHASILGKPWIPNGSRPAVANLFDIVEPQLATWLDGIITASDDIKERFDSHDNVTTITNYPLKHWLRDVESKPDKSSVQIAYCGKITPHRAIPELIEATKVLAQYHDIKLVLGGKYTTEHIEQLVETEADQHQFIETTGWLPTIDDVIDLFYNSDIGAMLIKPDNENQIRGAQRSNKTFQYMSTGTAVLGSDVGTWPEYIEDENCGVCVDTTSISDMVQSLRELIENPDMRKTMGRNGQEAVKQRYNWESQERKLLDFYQDLGI